MFDHGRAFVIHFSVLKGWIKQVRGQSLRIDAEHGPEGTSAGAAPFDDNVRNLARSVDSMLDSMSQSSFFKSSVSESWEPAVNVYEFDHRIVVCVDLAGVNPGEFEVQVERDVLHIKGQRNKPLVPDVSPDEQVCVHLMEIDSGRFHRKLTMPQNLDLRSSKAIYRNGLVWIVLPIS